MSLMCDGYPYNIIVLEDPTIKQKYAQRNKRVSAFWRLAMVDARTPCLYVMTVLIFM